jgi:hypothetical protein
MANSNLIVLNALGEEIHSSFATGTSEQIDLSSLAKGIYFLKVQNNENASIIKLSKN